MKLKILNGYFTIQLYRKVSGTNRWPHTIVWDNCGNTLVGWYDFQRFNQYRWLKQRDPKTGSYYAYRYGRDLTGKRIFIFMAREVLGLPHGAGHGGSKGDHKDFDTLNNTVENLRVASSSQSTAHTRKYGILSQFKGVSPKKLKFQPYIWYDGQRIFFRAMRLEIEAALMYNYAAIELQGEFACVNTIPENEIPVVERQEQLRQMVFEKLRGLGLLK